MDCLNINSRKNELILEPLEHDTLSWVEQDGNVKIDLCLVGEEFSSFPLEVVGRSHNGGLCNGNVVC